MDNIVKKFGTIVANDNVSIQLNKGEILAIIGENGAGKTTLMKILYGMYQPDEGQILINGKPVVFKNPVDAIAHKIGMVQQHFMLFDDFTVAENIVYGREPKKYVFFDRTKCNREVEKLCDIYQLPINPKRRVYECPVGVQQRIEILKVLYQDVDVIIFDEPTAVLIPQEVDELLKTIKKLASMGKSIILITHKLNEVMNVADTVTVMRNGRHVKTLRKSETSIEELSYLMVGRKLEKQLIKDTPKDKVILDVKDMVLKKEGEKSLLDHVNLTVHTGEIVGIAGVSGNGQSELIQCLTGLTKVDSGTITLNGKDITNHTVREVRESGVAVIPEDRYQYGTAKNITVKESLLMGHEWRDDLQKYGIFRQKEIKRRANKLIEQFGVKVSSQEQKCGELSGGNMQKAIVAREVDHNTPFLIAAEPTRGVDIGAIEFIHSQLVQKRENGDGILLISSELTEIMALADTIYVMYEGKIAGKLKNGEATKEKIGILMAGGSLSEQNQKSS